MKTLQQLWDAFIEVMADNRGKKSVRASTLLAQIEKLETDLRVASRLLGMISPFAPVIAPKSGGAKIPVNVAMATAAPVKYPWMTNAIQFLRNKDLITATEFRQLDQATRREVLHVPNVEDREVLKNIRTQVSESLKAGETPDQFRHRIKDAVALEKSQSETLLRTNSKQGYLVGKERTLRDPAIHEQFPYVEYVATDDPRVRPEHLDADGIIVEVGTPQYNILRRQLMDYNCRCDLIPLSREKAQKKGNIKDEESLPQSVKNRYNEPSPSEGPPIPEPMPVRKKGVSKPTESKAVAVELPVPVEKPLDTNFPTLRLSAEEKKKEMEWYDELEIEKAETLIGYIEGIYAGSMDLAAGDENGKDQLRKHLFSAVKGAPKVEGVVYRGLKIGDTDLIQRIEEAGVGGIWVSNEFHSTSMDPSIATSFAIPDSASGPDVMVKIHTKTGRNISSFSIDDEMEVLGMPGAQYRIKSITRKPKLANAAEGVDLGSPEYVIEMEEI